MDLGLGLESGQAGLWHPEGSGGMGALVGGWVGEGPPPAMLQRPQNPGPRARGEVRAAQCRPACPSGFRDLGLLESRV